MEQERVECPECGFPMATEADDAQLSRAAFDSPQYDFDSPPSACLGPTDLELFGDVLCWATIVGWHRDGEMAEAVKFWRQKALALQKTVKEGYSR